MTEALTSSALITLLSSYPILTSLASQLSTLDLFHLALTSKVNFAYILAPRSVFTKLSHQCLCDGHGLRDRKAFAGLYRPNINAFSLGSGGRIREDEEIEVRVFNRQCDPADTLPCCKCGINVCEECRYYPRTPPDLNYPVRRPHLNSHWQLSNTMCLCPTCDKKTDQDLEGKHLNELCDCDVFTRWICSKCGIEEIEFFKNYLGNRTILERYEDPSPDPEWVPAGPTKIMSDYEFEFNRAVWCLCGASVPAETIPRCTWCKRRHLPEEEWPREWNEVGNRMPPFENDTDYPFWVTTNSWVYPDPYPFPGYTRWWS